MPGTSGLMPPPPFHCIRRSLRRVYSLQYWGLVINRVWQVDRSMGMSVSMSMTAVWDHDSRRIRVSARPRRLDGAVIIDPRRPTPLPAPPAPSPTIFSITQGPRLGEALWIFGPERSRENQSILDPHARENPLFRSNRRNVRRRKYREGSKEHTSIMAACERTARFLACQSSPIMSPSGGTPRAFPLR